MHHRIKESASLVFAGAALVWVAGCAAPSPSPEPGKEDAVYVPADDLAGSGGNGGNGGAG